MSVWKDHNTYRYRVQRQGRVIAGGARTRQEAVELEAKALRDLQLHRLELPPERTVAEALARYVESPEFAVLKEKRRTLGRLEELERALRGEPIGEAHLVADRIKAAGIAAGRSPYTINAPLRILRRVASLALRRWDWPARPDKITLVSERGRQTYLSQAEGKALLAELEHDPDAWAWCALALYAGLRKGEIERLRPDQIRGDVLVLPPKARAGKPGSVPILPPARRALERVPLGMSYDLMYKRFGVARRAIGRPDVKFHDLRHTFASWLAQTGATAQDIRDVMRHSQISTTSRYMHLDQQRLQEVTSRILLERRKPKARGKPRKAA